MNSSQVPVLEEHSTVENYSRDIARSAPEVGSSHPKICRFYSQGRYCQFGRRCRYLHQRIGPLLPSQTDQNQAMRTGDTNLNPGQTLTQEATSQLDSVFKSTERPLNTAAQSLPTCETSSSEITVPARHVKRERHKNPCRYFLSGYCAMAGRCHFWHPEDLPPLIANSDVEKSSNYRGSQIKTLIKTPRTPVTRPSVLKEEARLEEITPDVAASLRETEVSQLMKRFPKDKLIIQEREDGKLTYYRVLIEATDPDWPFDLKEIAVMVSFPDEYPLKVFTLSVPEDQDLPAVMGRYICKASEEWLQGKHATNMLIGKTELLFRPYLRWLDRNMERLFTEGARMLKKDIEAEKAGIEFVPYQQLQATVSAPSSEDNQGLSQSNSFQSENSSQTICGSPVDKADKEFGQQTFVEDTKEPNSDHNGDSDSYTSCDDDDDGDEEEELGPSTISDKVRQVSSITASRRGTEMTFIGLQLGEGTSTLVAEKVTVSLQCNRCKIAADLTMSKRHTYAAQCEKCNAHISAMFRPSMLHQYSAVVGYLDLQGVSPVDLVLKDSYFIVGCLNCSSEEPIQGLSYGLPKEHNCIHCHEKLSVLVEATRFEKVQASSRTGEGGKPVGLQRKKKIPKDPSIQLGKPLPDQGACKHYRKSCRWLRFPCCGKAYPCDVCHDKDQDHAMELATRMICGYCAKEQHYSNGKPCSGCGNFLTKGLGSSHWEGGKGCRNKITMSRKDKQKYSSTAKTVSRRSQTIP
ncbi:uncharacterized protein LOC122806979 [Protopterus annectens]|uniref:uncharacterized protein LOC122806979 n=1 Tax=Protopterus annectens TaxID=7888 RepID=UPI001CFAF8F0|nr:uncharacterized protein LOC122806979 [Protopterus annectens]